jgi:hypothetical protein
LFAGTTTLARAHEFGADETGGGEEPAGQRRMAGEPWGVLREGEKHTLRNIPREVGVPADLSQRRRIDEIHMAFDQTGERLLGMVCDELPQQLGIITHVRIRYPPPAKNTQRICPEGKRPESAAYRTGSGRRADPIGSLQNGATTC